MAGRGWHLGGGETKGLVEPEPLGILILLRAFFKDGKVKKIALVCTSQEEMEKFSFSDAKAFCS